MLYIKYIFICIFLLPVILCLPQFIGTEVECRKPHEHYECGSACQTTCDNYNETCPIVNVRCNDDCYCDENYARDNSGRCIPVQKCPNFVEEPKIKCKKRHEHYDCGSACQTTCENLGEECDIINKTCNKGCYCDKGYARNSRGKCISIEKCP